MMYEVALEQSFFLEFFSFSLLITIPPLLSDHQSMHQGDLECTVTSALFTSGTSFVMQLSSGCRVEVVL
jgi:hypothetical protein